MTQKRARELEDIAAGLHIDALVTMDSGKFGHVEGVEGTIVLAELARRIMLDVVSSSIADNLDEGED